MYIRADASTESAAVSVSLGVHSKCLFCASDIRWNKNENNYLQILQKNKAKHVKFAIL